MRSRDNSVTLVSVVWKSWQPMVRCGTQGIGAVDFGAGESAK